MTAESPITFLDLARAIGADAAHDRTIQGNLRLLFGDALLGKFPPGCLGWNAHSNTKRLETDEYPLKAVRTDGGLDLLREFLPIAPKKIIEMLAEHRWPTADRAFDLLQAGAEGDACHLVAESPLPDEGSHARLFVESLAVTLSAARHFCELHGLPVPAALRHQLVARLDDAGQSRRSATKFTPKDCIAIPDAVTEIVEALHPGEKRHASAEIKEHRSGELPDSYRLYCEHEKEADNLLLRAMMGAELVALVEVNGGDWEVPADYWKTGGARVVTLTHGTLDTRDSSSADWKKHHGQPCFIEGAAFQEWLDRKRPLGVGNRHDLMAPEGFITSLDALDATATRLFGDSGSVEIWANDAGEIKVVTRLADGATTPEAAMGAFEHRFDVTAAAIIDALTNRKLTAIVKDGGAVSAIYWKGGGAKRALFSGKVEIGGGNLLFFIREKEFSGWLASLPPLAKKPLTLLEALEHYSDPKDWAAFLWIEKEFLEKGGAASVADAPIFRLGSAPAGDADLYKRREAALGKLDAALKATLRNGSFRITGFLYRPKEPSQETEVPLRQLAVLNFGYAASSASGGGFEYSGVEIEEVEAARQQIAPDVATDPVSISTQQPQSADAETVPTRSRTKSKTDSARVRKRIEMVVAEAKRRWPQKPPSLRNAATILATPDRCPELGTDRLSIVPIREILSGSYPPMKKLGIAPPWNRKPRPSSGLR